MAKIFPYFPSNVDTLFPGTFHLWKVLVVVCSCRVFRENAMVQWWNLVVSVSADPWVVQLSRQVSIRDATLAGRLGFGTEICQGLMFFRQMWQIAWNNELWAFQHWKGHPALRCFEGIRVGKIDRLAVDHWIEHHFHSFFLTICRWLGSHQHVQILGDNYKPANYIFIFLKGRSHGGRKMVTRGSLPSFLRIVERHESS